MCDRDLQLDPLCGSFGSFPAGFFYMNAGEIALVYAYLLVTNFLESLLAVCVPIVLGFYVAAEMVP